MSREVQPITSMLEIDIKEQATHNRTKFDQNRDCLQRVVNSKLQVATMDKNRRQGEIITVVN